MKSSKHQRRASEDRVFALRLTYERRLAERDRIREARSFFARQLGPLPAFAGISIAAVGAFSDSIKEDEWLGLALGVFAVMVAASIFYSRMPAYRELRSYRVRETHLREGYEADTPEAWYLAENSLEKDIYGTQADRRWRSRLPRRNLDGNLQQQLDKERFGVFLVQSLFLVVIACLFFAREISWPW